MIFLNSITFPSFVILFIITICNAPSIVLAVNKLHRGMLKGMEMKTAAYQVCVILYTFEPENYCFSESSLFSLFYKTSSFHQYSNTKNPRMEITLMGAY